MWYIAFLIFKINIKNRLGGPQGTGRTWEFFIIWDHKGEVSNLQKEMYILLQVHSYASYISNHNTK